MSNNFDLASIGLRDEHELSDAFALAGRFLSRAKITDNDFPFEFSTALFAAVSFQLAITKINGTFKDVLDYIAAPEWDSTMKMLNKAAIPVMNYYGTLPDDKKKSALWANRFSRMVSDIPTEVAALSLVRQCYAHWLEALQAHYKNRDSLAQQKAAWATRNATPAPIQNTAPVPAKVSAMDRLDEMIGLDGVKSAVRDLINMANYDARRKEEGLPIDNAGSLHLVFSGNPGTGKTGVAGLVAEIYKENGLLKRGHIVKVDRKMLMGEHIGKTENIMRKFVEEAMDGVLFIDEAHDLYKKESPNDYGHDVIASLLTTLENNRDRLAVILAVYKDKKEEFFTANQGLISRFPTIIEFDDYDPDALTRILHKILDDFRYYYDDVVKNDLRRQMEEMYRRKNEFFANGRDVRNFFTKIKNQHAKRIAGMPKGTDMQRLLVEDIPNIYPSHLAPCGGSDQKQAGEIL